MVWLFEHFQFVLIVGLALAGWLKTRWETRAERQQSEMETEEWEEAPYEPAGTPAPFVPPPIEHRPAPPPLPTATFTASAHAAAEDISRALKHQQDLAERLRIVHENRGNTTTTTGGAATTRNRLAARDKPAVFVPGALTLNKRLRTPAELRAAIVMREILDKPLGLR